MMPYPLALLEPGQVGCTSTSGYEAPRQSLRSPGMDHHPAVLLDGVKTARGSAPGRLAPMPEQDVGLVPAALTKQRRPFDVERLVRRASQGAILVLAEFVALELLGLDAGFGTATDQQFYRDAAARWLATGQFYLPQQLTGPYHVVLMRDVLYPPIALWLLVPFYYLPRWMWYVVPMAALGHAIWSSRPAAWAWAVMAVLVAWPYTLTAFLLGNTTMWAAAFVGLGSVWGWPAPFVLFKPSLAPFALAGVRRRAWWLGFGFVIVACLSLGALWLDYIEAMRNSDLRLTYSILDLPLMCLPVVAWLGRRPEGAESVNGPIERIRHRLGLR